MSMSQDLAAIDVYIKTQPAKTKAAVAIRDDWTVWYDGLSWWGTYSQENYDHARNLRNKFNLANATTAEDVAQVMNVMQNGLTTEELAGGTRRTLSNGMYDEPFISESTKLALGVSVVMLGIGVIAYGALDFARKLRAFG